MKIISPKESAQTQGGYCHKGRREEDGRLLTIGLLLMKARQVKIARTNSHRMFIAFFKYIPNDSELSLRDGVGRRHKNHLMVSMYI